MAGDDGREIAERRRRERLAAALRENLKRRKTQRREREAAQDAASPEGRPADASDGPNR
jgi:hypothetical protein